jgi:uncharacterized membrane protein required for colicin V production
MHWLDCTLIALLSVAAIFGAWSGLLKQVFRWFGFGLSAWAAVALHSWTDGQLRARLLDDADANVSRTVAYSLVFLVVFGATFLVSRMLERGIEATDLQFYNRLFGAVLAAAKMTVLLGAIFFGLEHLPLEEPQRVLKESVLASVLVQGADAALEIVPAKYKGNGWQKVSSALPGT